MTPTFNDLERMDRGVSPIDFMASFGQVSSQRRTQVNVDYDLRRLKGHFLLEIGIFEDLQKPAEKVGGDLHRHSFAEAITMPYNDGEGPEYVQEASKMKTSWGAPAVLDKG